MTSAAQPGQLQRLVNGASRVGWELLEMRDMPVLESFTIDNDLAIQTSGGVEVTLRLKGLSPRWCYFIRPEALAACGDWIPGTTTRFHYGSPHMIVVAGELNAETIGQALRGIDALGHLEECSLPLA